MERPSSTQNPILSWFKRLFGKELPASPPESVKPEPNKQEQIIPPDFFGTTYDKDDPTLLKQRDAANQYRNIIEEVARRYNLKPSVLCGMGSRESHWGLALTPPGPTGRGDFAQRRPRGKRRTPEPPDGGGYGRGLMQIDYDWHEFARTGKWQNPKENLNYACTVLEQAKTFFQKKGVRLSEDQMLRAIIAAYNGGATATLRAIEAGQDIDANTTGLDYSKDVLSRSGWFQLHGWR